MQLEAMTDESAAVMTAVGMYSDHCNRWMIVSHSKNDAQKTDGRTADDSRRTDLHGLSDDDRR